MTVEHNLGFGRYVYDIGDGRRIHTIPDTGDFVISQDDCWLPGAYESREAAEYAFRFTEEGQALLQQLRNKDSGLPIALSDLWDLERTLYGGVK